MNWKLKLIKLSKKLDQIKMYQCSSKIDKLLEQYDNIIYQCAWCKKIKDPETEEYFEADIPEKFKISHGIYPQCKKLFFQKIKN